MHFVVVEDRLNRTLDCCKRAAASAGEDLYVLARSDSPPAYQRFSSIYQHFSPNSISFELICFRRYFLLHEHLQEHPELSEVVLIDSDVMLFRGASAHLETLRGENIFLGCLAPEDWNTKQISPHVSYWRREALAAFVGFLLESYENPQSVAGLAAIAEDFSRRGWFGGVSDMTLLYLWAEQTPNCGYANQVTNTGSVDHNINMSFNGFDQHFETQFGIKRLSFDAQGPRLIQRDERIRAVALHFQGKAKFLMPYALHGNDAVFRLAVVGFVLWRVQKEMTDALRRRVKALLGRH